MLAVALMGGSACDPYPQIHWPGIHRGPRNSDAIDSDGATRLEPLFTTPLRGVVGLAVTLGPTDTLYATTGRSFVGDPCHFYILDPFTGVVRGCTDALDERAVRSAPLSDAGGRVFIADGRFMHAFTPEGQLLWKSPIDSAPLSAQLTRSGRLIFISSAGIIYVLDRSTGEQILEPVVTVPGATGGDTGDCLRGGAGSGCVSANTLAIASDDTFYFTLARGGAHADVVAMQLRADETPPRIVPLWASVGVLGGGGGASPTLSASEARLYLTDNAHQLIALEAASGEVAWRFDIGFAPAGSPSVSSSGRIVPAALGRLLAVQDDGPRGRLLWSRPDIVANGLVAQAGDVGYTVADGALLVFEADTGRTLQSLPGPRNSVGVSLASDGRVYTVSLGGEIRGYGPALEATRTAP